MLKPTSQPPYPSISELYHALSLALDTKQSNPRVNRLVREGDFDWSALDELAHSILLEPLTRHVDTNFAEAVHVIVLELIANYRQIVCHIALDSLDRQAALPLLIEHIFAPAGAALLIKLSKQFEAPPLAHLLDQKKRPLEEILLWLEQSHHVSLLRDIYPKTVGSDRANRDLIRMWRKEDHLPDLISIRRISIDIEKKLTANGSRVARDLRRWLIVARALTWLEKQSLSDIRPIMLRQILMNFPIADIGQLLTQAVRAAAAPYAPFSRKALELQFLLKPNRKKDIGERNTTAIKLNEIEELMAEFDPDGRTNYFLEWLQGRWHIQSGQPEKSFPHYQNAVEQCLYRAGDQQEIIIGEALALAANLGKKAFLKQLKHRAISLGLFASPSNAEQLVGDWEILQWQHKYHQYFPMHGLFPECSPEAETPSSLPFLVFDERELAKIKPDLGNPDRVRKFKTIDQQERRYPQLIHFASCGNTTAVKALLAAGADVNLLDESGGSALLCALQRLRNRGDREPVDCLLTRPHSVDSLDSRTRTKCLTPLLVAIDHGDPAIVERLLSVGASSDLPGRPENQSPLYFALTILMEIRNPNAAVTRYVTKINDTSDPETLRVIRRHGVPLADAFGQLHLNNMGKTAFGDYRRLAAEGFVKDRLQRHTESSLRRMMELLLISKANPNRPHEFPTPGRTPLMLAAEMDCHWAFSLMLEHGGDPEQKDGSGLDCRDIAIGFESRDIIRFLARTHLY